MKINFTDRSVASLPPSEGDTVFYTDAKLPGFQLMVGRRTRTWRVFGLLKGRTPCHKKLGQFPFMKTAEARQLAFDAIAAIKRGEDPREPKAGKSLSEALEWAITRRTALGKLSASTAEQYRRMIKLYCPKWLRRDLASIERSEIVRLHHDMADKPYAANQVIRILSVVFKANDIFPNPARDLEQYPAHERELGIRDLSRWYQQVMALENPIRRNRLLLGALTGIRSGNLNALEWSQIDLDARTIFLPVTKTRRNVTLPLADQSVGLLKELRGLDPRWVFPSSHSKAGHMIEARSGQDGSVHDLRRVFTTACAHVELPPYAMRALRGDRPQGVDEAYVKGCPPQEWTQRVADHLYGAWGAY